MSQENKPSMKKWYIPIFLFGLAIGYIGLNNGCNIENIETDKADTVVESLDTTTAKNIDTKTIPAIEEGLKSVTLPGGKEIAFKEGSTTEKIVTFLNADEMDMKTGFDLDNSDRQINNLAALLEVYSDFGIKLEGKKSALIKSTLVKKGIDAKRIDSKTKEGNVKLYFTE